MFILGKIEMLLESHKPKTVENFASENLDASVVPKKAGRFFGPVPEFL